MNCFCTGATVLSSPNSGQLQEALPGAFTKGAADMVGLSARSVPSVDSTMVFRLPTTTTRHGVFQGNVDSGADGPAPLFSRSVGKSMRYSLLRRWGMRREPQ